MTLPRLTALACALTLLSGCVVPIPVGVFSSGPVAAKDFREAPAGPAGDIVREVNAFRAQNGLPPLSWNDRLAAAALGHAQDLDRSGTFAHEGSRGSTLESRLNGAGYRWCAAAENISRGQPTPARVVSGWINSPGHRANMLKTNVREAGAALSAERGRNLWVLNLGAGCF